MTQNHMETITMPIDGRQTITFAKCSTYHIIANAIGHASAKFAMMRHLYYGDMVVAIGGAIITFERTPSLHIHSASSALH